MLIRAALPIKCPSCSAEISWRVASVQFLCPKCGRGIRLRAGYFRGLYVVSAVMTSLVAYAVGVRGDSLLATVFIFLFPVYILLTLITVRLFPPEAEPTGDYRGILYPVTQQNVSTASDHIDATETSNSRAESITSGAHNPLFPTAKSPWTLEGMVLAAAALVLALFAVWMAARPVIYRVFPEFGATQVGSVAFPVTVHIGERSIKFTNGSTDNWNCNVSIGVAQRYAVTFEVDAKQSREVVYGRFAPSGTDWDELRRLSREKLVIECSEPSGRPHLWIFS
jgi:predicted RNA-binding Zn-ribbon protein involved in translation (DUF1610 family)